MKLIRKKRLFISSKNTSIGIIFIFQSCNLNINKKINLNKTYLYYTSNYIQLFESQNINTILKSLNIIPKEIINIYKNKLYIIVLNTRISSGFKETKFLDLYKYKTTSIYNDIYNYNKNNIANNYLNTTITDDKNIYKLNIINLYYYLIGYI
jgi:hypothetical protein